MISILSRFRRYLIGGALVIVLGIGGFTYVGGLHDRIDSLSTQAHTLERDNLQLSRQLEQNIVDFQKEAKRWQDAMETYRASVEENANQVRELRSQLRENETEEVRECLYRTPLSDATLDRLFNYP